MPLSNRCGYADRVGQILQANRYEGEKINA